MENTLQDYVSLLQELKANTNDEGTAILLLQEIAKDRRTEQMTARGQITQEATPKQLAFLEKLNVEYDAELSKSEASQLIDEALQNK